MTPPRAKSLWPIPSQARVSVISDSNNTVVATVQRWEPVPEPRSMILPRARSSCSIEARPRFRSYPTAPTPSSTTVSVGTNPYGAAYDSAKGEVFVANEGDGTVSVISDSFGTSTYTSSTSSASHHSHQVLFRRQRHRLRKTSCSRSGFPIQRVLLPRSAYPQR